MSLADALAASPPPAGARVRIAVPDGTRPLDVGMALTALRPWLSGDVRAIVGLGLHRRMRPDELPTSPFPLVQHDPDDTVPTAIVDGIPGGIARAAADADVLLGVGIVELHQYAGFSGGHKAVAVGLGARATLDALHHRDRVTAPGVRLGKLEGNPFRAAVDGLGEAAGCHWTLLLAGGRWFAGEPRATLAAAAASLACWEDVPRRYSAAILRVPPKKAVNFYQASRAATYLGLSDDPPLVEGATLYLEASCPEGMGEGDGERAFAAVLATGKAPWAALLDGPAPVGAGTQRAVMIAALARRYPLVVTGVRNPASLRACGIDAVSAPAIALAPPDALLVADPFARIPRYAGP
ncbi:MAG: lactate racemase domain-containing protein [Pseudomonadota bacterium]|nr:lactate racemase domain-containing protein [Pseudomonadota bacterium]